MMEKKHRCKLCFRNFANGRALGGHMRSHMMKLYAEQKASKQEQEEDDLQSLHSYSSTPSSLSSSSSSSEEEEEDKEFEEEIGEVKEGLSYELRENPKKSTLFVDHELSVVLQDRESETESSKKKRAICRRSKRVRKSRVDPFSIFQVKRPKLEENSSLVETEPLSSISDTTPEEHVAHCLIMLSKDRWERAEMEYREDEGPEKKYYSEDSGVVKVIKTTKVRGKYRCEACNKLFRSYQALGGHRASHNKVKVNAPDGGGGTRASTATAAAVEKIHQCPFCHRVFSSGQALGGHKRSHFIGGGAISTNCRQNSRNSETNLNIDLNLPAPIEEDENSQIAVSAVSDAEFLHPIKQ